MSPDEVKSIKLVSERSSGKCPRCPTWSDPPLITWYWNPMRVLSRNSVLKSAASQIADIGLFVQLLVQVNIKVNIKALHYWSFVKTIRRWPVDSPHKGPMMRKACPCRDVIMASLALGSMWLLQTKICSCCEHNPSFDDTYREDSHVFNSSPGPCKYVRLREQIVWVFAIKAW